MNPLKLFRVGKVKEVYEVDERTLEFVFTDSISVFDKVIPTKIPFKGEALCRTAAFWFQLCKKNGIRTDFTELIPPNRMRVKRVDIIEDYSSIDGTTSNYLIPLEIICRHYVAGSLMDRIKKGVIPPEDLGFDPGHDVKYGEPLPRPFLETTTKLERFDRVVDKDEAMDIAGLSETEYGEIMDTVLQIDTIIEEEAAERQLIHVDGKKEFGYDEKRRLMVVDTFGTSDEDRWWDEDEYSEGVITELSKEMVRQHYRETGYFDKLMEARRNGEPEPDIPPLPEEMVNGISNLYKETFERITGESFR